MRLTAEKPISLVFVPRVRSAGTSERSPKMLEILSDKYRVEAIEIGRLNRFVFDQGKNKLARYLLFPIDVTTNMVRTLRALRRTGGDLVFGEGSYFSFAGGIAAKIRQAPMIWDNHGHIVTFSQAQGKSSFFTKGNIFFEHILERVSSKVVVVNNRDREDYIAMGFDPDKLVVVPTFADMARVREGVRAREEAKRALGLGPEEKVLLFVGTLTYEPNVDAASYLASVLPELRSRHPEAHLYVAGSGAPPFPAPEGMTFLGFVPDLYIWLSAADLCVAPMWRGVGILTKVIDYMSASRATVVTPLALDGIPELAHGENCLLGKDKEDFVVQVNKALEDEGLREKIAAEGYKLLLAKYSRDVVERSLTELVDSLVCRRNPL